MNPQLLVAAALFSTLAAGCGPSLEVPANPTIEDLRRLASARPEDASLRRRLAIGEVLMDGGDPELAAVALDRASSEGSRDAALSYFTGLVAASRGDAAGALDAYLEALRAGAEDANPLGPAFAELAIGGLGSLAGEVRDWEARVRGPVSDAFAQPGQLGAAARLALARLLIRLAYRDGDSAAVRTTADESGCLTQWRVAGPFGPRALLGFDDPNLPPGGMGSPLEDEYVLGPVRGRRQTRAHEARGCSVHLGNGPVSGEGTTLAEAHAETPSAGVYILRLETPNPVELFVDGDSVARLDRRRELIPRVTYHPVWLEPGHHRVAVKVATRHPNPVLLVALTGAEGRAASNGPATTRRENADAYLPRVQEGSDLESTFAQAALSFARGDAIGAREALVPLSLGAAGSPYSLELRASVALSDPLSSEDVRRDRARELLRMAARRHPGGWEARYRLAQLAAGDGQLDDAIDLLRVLEAEFPDVAVLPRAQAEFLRQRGWEAQSEEAIERARALVPESCATLALALDAALARERWSEAGSLAASLRECDARRDALYRFHVRRRAWSEAAAELTRLERLEPEQNRYGYQVARLQLERGRGDTNAVRELVESMRALQPQSTMASLAQADLALATGGRAAARQVFDAALAAEPTAQAELHLVAQAITGDFALTPFRLDGLRIRREFEASGRTYDEPQVLVLDYTVVRVFEDGSTLELTHNLWRVQSEEVLDDRGEFQPPQGARVLTLRTIKPDGSILEPDAIEGKETISLPQLAVGDYVEYEYVRSQPSSPGFAGGFLGDRFYFRSFEVPFDLSQLTVALPESMDPVIDARGPAPPTEERVERGLRILRWTARESRPFRPEPDPVPLQEWAPSVNVGVGANWEAFVEGMRDALADKNLRDPAAERLVREVLGEASGAPPGERARRLYTWVLANIEEDGDFFGLAPAMLARRTGSRGRVLHYLMELDGIEADLLAARPIQVDSVRSELVNSELYRELVLRVHLEGEDIFLYTAARGAPFGFIPPAIRGQEALAIAEPLQRVTLPPHVPGTDRRTVTAQVALREDGSADVFVREVFRGASAVAWRNDLEEVPAAMLRQRFEEAYVARLVAGAELTELRITGREDPEQPVVFEYRFQVAAFGRIQDGLWLLPPLFQSNLSAQYSRASERQTPQLIGRPVDVQVEITVEAPPGAPAPRRLEETRLEGPRGALATTTNQTPEAGTLVLRRSVRLPIMRVPPDEFEVLAEFCRGVDQAEARELRQPTRAAR